MNARIMLIHALIAIPLTTFCMERIEIKKQVTSSPEVSPRTAERRPIQIKNSKAQSDTNKQRSLLQACFCLVNSRQTADHVQRLDLAMLKSLQQILTEENLPVFRHKIKKSAQEFANTLHNALKLNDPEAGKEFSKNTAVQSYQELYNFFHQKLFPPIKPLKTRTIWFWENEMNIKSEEYPGIIRNQNIIHTDCAKRLKDLCLSEIKDITKSTKFATDRARPWKAIHYLHNYFYTLLLLAVNGLYISEAATSGHFSEKLPEILSSKQAIPLYVLFSIYFLIYGAKWVVEGSPFTAFKNDIIEISDILSCELQALNSLHEDLDQITKSPLRIAFKSRYDCTESDHDEQEE